MKDFEDLKQEIQNSSEIVKISSTGFYELKCPVCNDNKIRAGFKFGGDTIGYNCFRGKCDANVMYTDGSFISNKFRHLMDAMNIDIPANLRLNAKDQKIEIDMELYTEFSYDTHKISKNFEKYDPKEHPEFRRYLAKRNITSTDFFIHTKQWNTLVIPFWYYGRLIGWQKHNIKTGYYEKSSDSALIYLPQGKIPRTPIIVEGVFDALSIPNGIAVLGNKITKEQGYILRNFTPILLPDTVDSRFPDIAKKYGWKLCLPDWGKNAKDANDVSVKHGKIYLSEVISKGILTDQQLEDTKNVRNRFKQWCQKGSGRI